ncbi:hypothetical protein ACEPAI_7076 [Sanghuangporus weigelae]
MYALKNAGGSLGSSLANYAHRHPSSSSSLRSATTWVPNSGISSSNPGGSSISHNAAYDEFYGEYDDDVSDEDGRETETAAHEAGIVYADNYYTGSASTIRHDDLAAPNPALDQSPQAKEIARLRAELKSLREKHYALQSAFREASTQVRTKDILLDQLRERNRTLDAENTELRRVAEERRLEVRSMERFLTKTDRWAGSDLVQAVKDINSEILQFAAAASEAMHPPVANGPGSAAVGSRRNTPSPSPAPGPSAGRRKALERVAARFGSKMRQVLEKRDHSQDPTILQYALQGERPYIQYDRRLTEQCFVYYIACVCQCIAHAMSSFCFGSTGKLESHLSKIYSHMHASEPQPTSSRWRALTHSHIRALSPNIDQLATNEVTDTCLRGVANVLSAGGAGEVEELLTRATQKYRSQLRRIAELANRFAFIIREGTMSTDFQPLFVESVREFNPVAMENVYEGYGPSRGRVLCTTEVGLQCLTNKGKDGKDFSPQTVERRVVLKPRVVLESIVQILDR